MKSRTRGLLVIGLLTIILLSGTSVIADRGEKDDKDDRHDKDKKHDKKHHKSKHKAAPVKTRITEAYYADLDDDGLEDDIRIEVDIEVLGKRDRLEEDGALIYLQLDLILPSGFTYTYFIEFMIYEDDVTVTFNLLNHATEQGWYTATVIAYNEDMKKAGKSAQHTVVFDPPGGQTGSDPRIEWWIA